MPTTLVTGGAGFLGSHLVDLLLEKGHTVIALDNFITGNPRNLDHITSPDFSFIEMDICDPALLTTNQIPGKLDYIFNMASPASPIDYLKIPIETLEVGSIGTMNVLKLAVKHKARVLVASTSEVYGDPRISPQPETYWGNVNPVGPRGCYDESKRFQEAAVMAYQKIHGLETRIVRIFNTFGPRMRLDDGRVVPAFMSQVLSGQDITVFGDGSQTRSFCYVDDLIDGIYKLMMSDYSGPVNIGNPDEITIQEFAEEINAMMGNKQNIIYKPLPQDDPMQRKPDIALAKQILDWHPKWSRAEGIKPTMEYFKAKLNLE